MLVELFLNQDNGFNKRAIGEALCESDCFNQSILNALMELQDFSGDDLDCSLRKLFSIFKLPGSVQKVDRVLEKFASKYCRDNSSQFSNPDCCFVLAFSLLMLTTDHFNPNIKKKITKEQFVRNNRGIDNGADLPAEYLEQLYDSVAAAPIIFNRDDVTVAPGSREIASGLHPLWPVTNVLAGIWTVVRSILLKFFRAEAGQAV
eukprot:gnl/TRDRNA2_/TRDRNA2_141532_c1_seq2.p1 gnl/TRDRNA2_/TRDRNA2_141532_c1~~gnl/TRDRNA2_/TRDRNA2_141532_c1_seq2.p1  ORF type:complete len:204 (+),score=37.75 gnl/TRDRNA2_/TRDRNA2_141532_c1_seq2:2-613(+)